MSTVSPHPSGETSPEPSTQVTQDYALIVDSSRLTGQQIADTLSGRLLFTTRLVTPRAGVELSNDRPMLAFVSVATNGDEALDYMRVLHRKSPTTTIIVYGPPSESLTVAQAMNAGARYFLTTPFDDEALITALDLVRQEMSSLATLARTQAKLSHHGRLITVFSPKGGSGSTTLAVNMASSFSQQGFRTAIVDCNLNFGNVGIFFGVTPEKTITDCIPTGSSVSDMIDPGDVMRSMVHHSSGVDLLLAPLRPEEGERITKEHLNQIIAILKKTYERVIVDTWTSYDDRVIEFMDRSDAVIVPVLPELPAMRNLGAFCRVIKAIQLPLGKFRWVLVRANTVPETDVEDMERFLSLTIHHRVVSDGRLVLGAVRDGMPFVLSHPETQVALDVTKICRAVNEQLGEIEPAARDSDAEAIIQAKRETLRGSMGLRMQDILRRLRGQHRAAPAARSARG